MEADADAETRVRMEAKAEVIYWDVGILIDIMNKVRSSYIVLKR